MRDQHQRLIDDTTRALLLAAACSMGGVVGMIAGAIWVLFF